MTQTFSDNRATDVKEIRRAYYRARDQLREVGRLIRANDAGKYMWAGKHKTAISGIVKTLEILNIFSVMHFNLLELLCSKVESRRICIRYIRPSID